MWRGCRSPAAWPLFTPEHVAHVSGACHLQISGRGASLAMLWYLLKTVSTGAKVLAPRGAGVGGGHSRRQCLALEADFRLPSAIRPYGLTLHQVFPQRRFPGQQGARCASGAAPRHAPDS